ncbi:MAG: bifunctional 3,4-dihydroxy-2-butanone-4-phosphate synthase/GTP cyclohydrolase II [Verrucomicrobiales bacterium]|jgi:3,4-dihydroxy 2-butanone 4-phosphate synthase/GTP cyclohydrolase II|nr:bifunctional 3,4-dihydroxy-2-butanone-4-phosphate synthase/GTP cyclohydrolase II [Verrucomicrobiales bacterium]
MKPPSPAASAKFSPIEELIAAVRQGRLVIMTDDPARENEGDVIVAAEKVTPSAINFMVRHARGLVCAPITQARARQLGLQRMVVDNRDSLRTDYTVSVDAARGVTTGISAADRARAVKILSQKKATPADLIQPGHIFPLQAKPGGVLQRAGHTEAAVDLARLAGLDPSAAICEIMKDDGEMARLPDLLRFAADHDLKIGSIRDLIEYRRRTEKLVVREETVTLPTDYGQFDLHLYRSALDGAHHLALSKGKLSASKPLLVRVHSECLTGDIFGSQRCDCGHQLHDAMRMISGEGGVLVYMRGQEGRGIGIGPKIHAYKLQEQGLDTVEANVRLGYPADLREYGIGAQILYDLGVRRMRLLTNNPKKVVNLAGYGLEIVAQVPIRVKPNRHNKKYLETKKTKMGHLL